MLAVFERSSLLSPIYLAVDGKRTQQQILTHLKAQGISTSQPAVSRWMTVLEDEGLIEKVAVDGAATIWDKKRELEKVLRLSRRLAAAGKNVRATNRNQ
jgi:arginine repressor